MFYCYSAPQDHTPNKKKGATDRIRDEMNDDHMEAGTQHGIRKKHMEDDYKEILARLCVASKLLDRVVIVMVCEVVVVVVVVVEEVDEDEDDRVVVVLVVSTLPLANACSIKSSSGFSTSNSIMVASMSELSGTL